MSRFTKTVQYVTEFQGDTVKVTLERLKRKDLLMLAPLMPKADSEGKVTVNLDTEDNLKLLSAVADRLPDYVKSFEGLKDANGEEITIQDVAEEAYFGELLSDIFAKLFDISFVSEDEIKNSNVLLSDSSVDFGSSAMPK